MDLIAVACRKSRVEACLCIALMRPSGGVLPGVRAIDQSCVTYFQSQQQQLQRNYCNLLCTAYISATVLRTLNTTPCPEKRATILLPLTLPNTDRFSKFFHGMTLQ